MLNIKDLSDRELLENIFIGLAVINNKMTKTGIEVFAKNKKEGFNPMEVSTDLHNVEWTELLNDFMSDIKLVEKDMDDFHDN